MTKKMAIKLNMIVDTIDFNPFNFILYPNEYFTIPFTYSEKLTKILSPSLEVLNISEPLINYGQKILGDSGSDSLTFLTDLTRQIHTDFSLEYRHTGKPFSSEKTFERKLGSCRDLTWMQIQLLRHLGIASRFISGYYFFSTPRAISMTSSWLMPICDIVS